MSYQEFDIPTFPEFVKDRRHDDCRYYDYGCASLAVVFSILYGVFGTLTSCFLVNQWLSVSMVVLHGLFLLTSVVSVFLANAEKDFINYHFVDKTWKYFSFPAVFTLLIAYIPYLLHISGKKRDNRYKLAKSMKLTTLNRSISQHVSTVAKTKNLLQEVNTHIDYVTTKRADFECRTGNGYDILRKALDDKKIELQELREKLRAVISFHTHIITDANDTSSELNELIEVAEVLHNLQAIQEFTALANAHVEIFSDATPRLQSELKSIRSTLRELSAMEVTV